MMVDDDVGKGVRLLIAPSFAYANYSLLLFVPSFAFSSVKLLFSVVQATTLCWQATA